MPAVWGEARGENGNTFLMLRMCRQSVDGKDLSEKRPDMDRIQEAADGRKQVATKDIVDSDDPDGARRSGPATLLSTQTHCTI